jgi:hypothetical protein
MLQRTSLSSVKTESSSPDAFGIFAAKIVLKCALAGAQQRSLSNLVFARARASGTISRRDNPSQRLREVMSNTVEAIRSRRYTLARTVCFFPT